jgi:hypothetical protein
MYALRTAMIQAFKLRNFGTAKGLAERLMAMEPPTSFVDSVCSIDVGDTNHSTW